MLAAFSAFAHPPTRCTTLTTPRRLFVGNIPKCYSEEHLHPVFSVCGSIVELVIQRDRHTHESKGSAFMWYTTRRMAEAAIARYNLSRALPDPTGEQSRALVVRRANARKLPAADVKAAMATQQAAAAAERSAILRQMQVCAAVGGAKAVPAWVKQCSSCGRGTGWLCSNLELPTKLASLLAWAPLVPQGACACTVAGAAPAPYLSRSSRSWALALAACPWASQRCQYTCSLCWSSRCVLRTVGCSCGARAAVGWVQQARLATAARPATA